MWIITHKGLILYWAAHGQVDQRIDLVLAYGLQSHVDPPPPGGSEPTRWARMDKPGLFMVQLMSNMWCHNILNKNT